MSGAIPVIIEKRGMAYMKKTKTRALSEKSRPAKKKKNQAFRTYVVQKMRLIEYIVELWLHHLDILLKASTPNFIGHYDHNYFNWDLRLWQATQHQYEHRRWTNLVQGSACWPIKFSAIEALMSIIMPYWIVIDKRQKLWLFLLLNNILIWKLEGF